MSDAKAKISAGLAKAHAGARARREAGVVLARRSPLEKARDRPRSLRLAVSAHCYTCQGADQDPGTRSRIRDCVVKKCELYAFRPYQRKTADKPVTPPGGLTSRRRFTPFTASLASWLNKAHDATYKDLGDWFYCTTMCAYEAVKRTRSDKQTRRAKRTPRRAKGKKCDEETSFLGWLQERQPELPP